MKGEMDVMRLLSEDLSQFDKNGNSSSTLYSTGSPVSPSLTVGQQWMIQGKDRRSDDEVLTRAMVAVINSASPSSCSSSSSPPAVHESLIHKPQYHGQFPAFKIYSPTSASAVNSDSKASPDSQKMIKMSIAMLRRISNIRNGESAPTSNRPSHVISERKRREKLNLSFDELRSLLPPGSKKDKASVLMKTRDYLKTLKHQISELELQNRLLEMKLKVPAIDEASNLRSKLMVEITQVSAPASEVQQIRLRLTATTNCDIIDLVLHVLECLKDMRALALVTVDANMCTPQMNLHASATVVFQIQLVDEKMMNSDDPESENSIYR
ncbi:hypothetical protein J5N97_019324 [Dioscorea zingiberensis]|uniref:BHLH domain-containing protein n=1 Tax=Dioscorea zingiberensis TaxID=325984 RepID=A0A9D5CFR7_9LILI|nr:hypothetical protein J5N97_019324 [Dioscorea zingiberensis]